jgi:hypothetical protein
MLSREDFMFTVGFQGNSAIIDSHQKRRYANLSLEGLLERGLYKPAICSAIASGKEDDLEKIFIHYNERSQAKLKGREELLKVFGISKMPEEIEKVIRI